MKTTENDERFLRRAIQESQISVENGGFPVGCVITQSNEIVARGISNGKQLHDPTAHAEICAIRQLCQQLQTRSLSGMTLYSSMEPCLMCLAACTWASIPRVVYAISRQSLDPMHFEGSHDIDHINAAMRKPVGLIHLEKLEPEGLKVIRNWETRIKP